MKASQNVGKSSRKVASDNMLEECLAGRLTKEENLQSLRAVLFNVLDLET